MGTASGGAGIDLHVRSESSAALRPAELGTAQRLCADQLLRAERLMLQGAAGPTFFGSPARRTGNPCVCVCVCVGGWVGGWVSMRVCVCEVLGDSPE